MANFLKKLFGSKADRDLKKMTPIVNACKAEYEQIDKLSDDALREASAALRQLIADHIAPEEEKVAKIKEQLADVEIEGQTYLSVARRSARSRFRQVHPRRCGERE